MTGNGQGIAIKVEHLTKRFGSRTVLDDVSFQIPKGTGFCILGRSGTGKSVTLKHIIGLLKPDGGRVFVEGTDITALTARELSQVRRRIGFLFQNAALFDSLTVGENVMFPMRRHTKMAESEMRQRGAGLLDQVGLEREFDKMPGDLSGGMRKRAGLARALALDPSVLLVDEPSAGLDPITSGEIDELLLDLKTRAKTTLVMVTHNIPSAKTIGDELAMIHDGRFIARGTAQELEQSDDPLVHAFMHSTHSG